MDTTNTSGLSLGGAGSGFGGVISDENGIDTKTVWNAAKQWVSAAGDKISETEAEIWKRINKE
jgi:hypothetical protein